MRGIPLRQSYQQGGACPGRASVGDATYVSVKPHPLRTTPVGWAWRRVSLFPFTRKLREQGGAHQEGLASQLFVRTVEPGDHLPRHVEATADLGEAQLLIIDHGSDQADSVHHDGVLKRVARCR
jgi:hypothetical protein